MFVSDYVPETCIFVPLILHACMEAHSLETCGDAADSAAIGGAQPTYEGKSEYYTQDEMAAIFKPKKKKVPGQHPPPTDSCTVDLPEGRHALLCAPGTDGWCWLWLPAPSARFHFCQG